MASGKGPIRVLHVGLGPIGAAIVRQVAERRGFRIVGGVDIDPAKAGRDLGAIAEVGRSLRIKVSADARKAIKASKPDVAVLCTSSSLKRVLPQIETILQFRVPIVSTTEELAYPSASNLRYAREVHRLAKKAKVAVLGTGVNPGFAMDALPITLTGVCERVEATESISMIADAMGWKLDRITDEIKPRIATETVASEFLAVDPGYVCGIVQDGTGYRDGKPAIVLHMEAYLGAPESFDAVEITGSPELRMKIAGGMHGDVATASIAVNSIPKILMAAPGLHTMRDMPLPSYYGG